MSEIISNKKILAAFVAVSFLFSCNIFTKSHQEEGEKSVIINDKKSHNFVVGSDDIPLYSGLNLIEEKTTNFDSLNGNIAFSEYLANSSQKIIQKFYLKTLPHLGWQLRKNSTNNDIFARERQTLQIDYELRGDLLFVQFSLSSIL